MPKLIVSILLMLFFCTQPPLPANRSRPALKALAREGNATMRSGNLPQADAIFRDGLAQARQKADWVYVSGFLTGLGVVRVNESRYRQALDYFLQAQDAARQADSAQDAGFAAFNIGVIYARLGDWQRGHAAILESARMMDPDQPPAPLHLNLANYESRFRNFGVADGHFRASIENSERREMAALAASSWEQWGLSYLDRGQLDPAEVCLLESYRLHRLAKRADAEQLHYGLARLALARGEWAEARRRAAQYLRAARTQPLLHPLWEAYRLSGEIEERSGNQARAYDYYVQGVDWARQARAERLPSAQLMATAEAALQSLYLSLIRVAQELHSRQPQASLLLVALEAAEEGRSAALVENSALLTDDYWQSLDRLQRTQARRLAADTPQLAREGERLRTLLVNYESVAGLRTASPSTNLQLISQARNALAPSQAILVFRTGEPHSYAWKLTRDSVELRTLPGENDLTLQVAKFQADALAGQALGSEAGKKLFFEIIGELSLRETTISQWTLVPDGPLHELPFAALPWPSARGIGSYLVEHRTLMLAPSVATLAITPQNAPTGPSFAGIADPIYNSADPRLSPLPQRADMLGLFRRRSGGGTAGSPASFELARLPGSLAELEAAVKTLRPVNPILLTGSQVNRQSFLSLLDRRAATLHLATHVVSAPGAPRHALIALGMNPRTRDQELVGEDEIHARRNSARLVIMSGCNSGRGEILPGVGLLSLTRAWIMSGAAGVVASHWPVPDQSGLLFERFYRYAQLSTANTNAKDWAAALQQAQIESIHDRIPASVWAAYFLTGRN